MAAKVKTKLIRITEGGGLAEVTKNTKPGGVKVGILKGTGEHSKATGGQTIAEIFFWNEFGTRDKQGRVKIPERPVMRTTMKSNGSAYRKIQAQILKGLLTGKLKVSLGEARLGLQVQSDLKNAIAQWVDPPNAPSTVALKGENNPLEDIGEMRNSVHWASSSSKERKGL
jgi:hypothetical protein